MRFFSLLVVISSILSLSACSGINGKSSDSWSPRFLEHHIRHSSYETALRKKAKLGEAYREYQLLFSVLAIQLDSETQSLVYDEMKSAYGEQFAEAALSTYKELFIRKDCPRAYLMRAWDGLRRRDPFETPSGTWLVENWGSKSIQIQKVRGDDSVLNDFFPFKVTWGDWHLACFSGERGSSSAEIAVRTPVGALELAW